MEIGGLIERLFLLLCDNRSCVSAAQVMDLDDFVEITKNYAQGIVPAVSQISTQESDGQVFKSINTFLKKDTSFHFNEVCLN